MELEHYCPQVNKFDYRYYVLSKFIIGYTNVMEKNAYYQYVL